jgi:hypothetical protein
MTTPRSYGPKTPGPYNRDSKRQVRMGRKTHGGCDTLSTEYAE